MLNKVELVSKSCSAAALSHRALYHCLSGGVSGGVSGVSGGLSGVPGCCLREPG